jgi:branched-chain amino acid transport system ATP-binding protein
MNLERVNAELRAESREDDEARDTRADAGDSARMSESDTTGDLLVASDVRKEFGGLLAVNDLDFTIPQRSIVSLIGPNGAGKTTFFNMLTGLYKPTSGTIVFDGTDITDKPPHAITKLGVGRTFQNIRLFPQMTALENVLVGMHARLKGGILGSILGCRASAARKARPGRMHASCSPSRGCGASTTSLPRASPTATSGASRSPAPWRRSRSCCFSTSRPQA